MKQHLYLPAITGAFGKWRYYELIMSVKDLVELLPCGPDQKPIYRVRTVDEVEEIYSKNINDMLQRVFDPKRLAPLKDYLQHQPERYVNNLTIAIYGGDPQWLPIDVRTATIKSDQIEDPGLMDTLEKRFGIIQLTGEEILFALDGQHRLKALRVAVQSKPTLAKDEIAVTLISHKTTDEGKKSTRRLFTTVNRYAKPVSLGESILLDEDDVSAILVRRLVDEFPLFKGKKLIAFNKGADLKLPTDADKFSTTLSLWAINELLIDKGIYPKYEGPTANLVRVRPDDANIAKQRQIVWSFWRTFFEMLPKARNFVRDPVGSTRTGAGPYSLRPIGQQIFAQYYLKAKSIPDFEIGKIKQVPDQLDDPFWERVLFDPDKRTIMKGLSYARDFLFHHLGIPLKNGEKARLLTNLEKNNKAKKLPTPLFK